MNLDDTVKELINKIEKEERAIVFINGPMGVGKTRLARTIIDLFGGQFPNSASYSLINVIDGSRRILHGDFYRQCLDSEILECELLPSLSNKFLLLLEWCEPFKILNNTSHYKVTISFSDQGYRKYSICSFDCKKSILAN